MVLPQALLFLKKGWLPSIQIWVKFCLVKRIWNEFKFNESAQFQRTCCQSFSFMCQKLQLLLSGGCRRQYFMAVFWVWGSYDYFFSQHRRWRISPLSGIRLAILTALTILYCELFGKYFWEFLICHRDFTSIPFGSSNNFYIRKKWPSISFDLLEVEIERKVLHFQQLIHAINSKQMHKQEQFNPNEGSGIILDQWLAT